jgi:hypothetical protein
VSAHSVSRPSQSTIGVTKNLYTSFMRDRLPSSGNHMRSRPDTWQPALARKALPSKKYKQMRNHGLANSLQSEQRSITDMIAEIARPFPDATLRSAAALAEICRGIITGEGPTVAGRIHFSRSIDADDTALCARILILTGRAGDPVSRAEADALFDIDAVASDRRDGGRFDDLLAKAVVHHVMAACGYDVPGRDTALAPTTSLNAWASAIEINTEVRAWLEKRMSELSRGGAATRAIANTISGLKLPKELTVTNLFDMAA